MTGKLERLKRKWQRARAEGQRDRYWKARREYLLEQGRRYTRRLSAAGKPQLEEADDGTSDAD